MCVSENFFAGNRSLCDRKSCVFLRKPYVIESKVNVNVIGSYSHLFLGIKSFKSKFDCLPVKLFAYN